MTSVKLKDLNLLIPLRPPIHSLLRKGELDGFIDLLFVLAPVLGVLIRVDEKREVPGSNNFQRGLVFSY